MALARVVDGCVVETAPLADIVNGFTASWNVTRPPNAGGRFSGAHERTEVTPIGAVRWLAGESGIPEDTINNIARRRHRRTELRIADALLCALDRPDLFHTLEVMPNPAAKPADRAACCGGSLTGTGLVLDRISAQYGAI